MTVQQGVAQIAGIARSVARGSQIASPSVALDIMLPAVLERLVSYREEEIEVTF